MNNLCFYFIERSNDRINIENHFMIIANVYNWHCDPYYWHWVRLKHCLGWGWLFCPSISIGVDKKWRAAPHWRFICFGGYTRFLVFICPPIWYDCSMSTNIFRVIALKKLCMSLIQSMLCINYVILWLVHCFILMTSICYLGNCVWWLVQSSFNACAIFLSKLKWTVSLVTVLGVLGSWVASRSSKRFWTRSFNLVGRIAFRN